MRFIASLFFESTVLDRDSNVENGDLWEEVLVLIVSNSAEDAARNAVQLGMGKSGTSYLTERGRVGWRFVAVERVVPFEDESLNNGMEIFSRFLRASEAKSILEKFD